MRVVSWNLGYGFGFKTTHDRAWDWLKGLAPDLAMLQEVRSELPEWTRDQERWTVVRRKAVNFGSLILAKAELGLAESPGEHPRLKGSDVYLATGTVTLRDGTSLLVGSVHTPVGRAEGDELGGFDSMEIKRLREPAPSRNDVAYAYYREAARGRQFLVSGDWNIARLWDYQYRKPPTHEVDFFDRAEADGWIECYRLRHPEGEGRTWFREGDPPYQMDHAFCDPVTAKMLRACDIDAHPAEDLKLSDHAPLILEFEP